MYNIIHYLGAMWFGGVKPKNSFEEFNGRKNHKPNQQVSKGTSSNHLEARHQSDPPHSVANTLSSHKTHQIKQQTVPKPKMLSLVDPSLCHCLINR